MSNVDKKLTVECGAHYGKLTVLRLAGKTSNGFRIAECQCECGKIRVVHFNNLLRGSSRSCGGCIRKLPDGEAQINSMFTRYGYNAKERGFEFKLTRDQFVLLIKGCCAYCGMEPQFRQKREFSSGVSANGIDRLDSLAGYLLENCVPCCRVCNRAKSDMSIEEFKMWVSKVNARINGGKN